ncbi:quinone-dependent dihydroorotate dehydrogenase [Cytophagaceae bacterium YF14B1]|uniref:Dihydroorotate dehydrogenase (quinone) n=1 Tax=Xanthocytophaga flava TaxID=3048013 RepID=A0AAE3U943_9BACT|nr:quinone-dependent dihydroorotate dehydrogenase [Xanthocytophaga flavus]MDJ1484664.1 quinone-dependent dihydroorotate dehydrogenase [Xanthocytophaga flavus]
MYRYVLQPLFFLLDAEKAHHTVFNLVKFLFRIPLVPSIFRGLYHIAHPKLERELFGIRFPNPVGIAAGFDKNAELITELADLGFGFIEIGTVTPLAQPGNPKPRMFRLKEDKALINRMGFNNEGAQAAATRIRKIRKAEAQNPQRKRVIIGGNIGKNKDTSNENAVKDYEICFDVLFDEVDYFVVNVSSPNTPGLRDLQDKEPLMKLLQTLQDKNYRKSAPKPILLKIAPDLEEEDLNDIVEIVQTTKIAGVIATNTTINYSGLKSDLSIIPKPEKGSLGGLSGQSLTKRATEVIRYLHQKSGGTFPIIGVGGIASPEDAQEKLAAGASLIQLYTGFIYEGPGIAKKINRAILKNNM